MGDFKAIFFDADDTLVNHKECEKQALLYLFSKIKIAYREEYQDIFRPLDNELWASESYDGHSVRRDDIPIYRFEIFFKKIQISFSDYDEANNLFKIGLANSMALTENADVIVKYLHNKGYMLCVVTNGLIDLQKPRITNSEIGNFFSYIMVSEEVGEHKPNPLIFNTLLKKINLNADNVIMIGDSLKNDIQGGKNAGIKTVWFNPEKKSNKTGILPDYEVNNLLQLKDFL